MEERKGFGSNFGFLMAAIGSAVGLGNIWGFPFKMGKNGGFAFLLIYLILAAFCGFIVMLGELALGRKTGKGAVAAYQVLSKKFKWVGWLGVASAFLIMSFYCALGGYCIKYVVMNVGNLFGARFGTNGLDGGTIFGNFMTNQWEGVIYGMIFLAITLLIVMGGVGGSIEKFCSIGMPCLFVMLIVVIIKACTLSGAGEGLKFMFMPDFTAWKDDFIGVLSAAGGQMFFSLSLGMGAMITYGSYLDKKQNLEKNSLIIVVCDTLIALMAGMAVLPAAFALGGEGASMAGPSLLFVTLQNVFDNMGPVGPIFGIIFYLLVVLAAVSSSISLMETVVTHFVDKAAEQGKGDKRKKYSCITAALIAVLCALVCWDGLGSNGVWVPFQSIVGVRGFNDCWLDFFDMISEGIFMPVGAFLMSIMIGWEIGPKVVQDECEASGHKMATRGFFNVCIKVITPLLLLFILYGQIKSFFF
jgi:NSS family neurotransmitter:Na+ symporter